MYASRSVLLYAWALLYRDEKEGEKLELAIRPLRFSQETMFQQQCQQRKES